MRYLLLLLLSFVLLGCKKEEPSSTEPIGVYIYLVTASPTSSESVVIRNNSGSQQDLANWKIGDSNDPNAYNIPSGNLLNQGTSVTFNASNMGFQINDSGETIYLKDPSGIVIDTWTN